MLRTDGKAVAEFAFRFCHNGFQGRSGIGGCACFPCIENIAQEKSDHFIGEWNQFKGFRIGKQETVTVFNPGIPCDRTAIKTDSVLNDADDVFRIDR